MADPMNMNPSSEPRQLVLLCDGTNNNLTGQLEDTNVVKLCTLLADHSDPQRLVYYDPGVGNPGELPGATGWDQFRRKLDRVNGLAFGRGVYENMVDCYLFLMRHYRQGDQLYIFGFSRGAFTARSVAGLVNLFGILQPHMESMLPTLLHVYFADRGDEDEGKIGTKGAIAHEKRRQFDLISKQTARLFTEADTREVDIHFIGVWDTVASVGLWPFDAKFTAAPTPQNKHFIHIRQAMALDEHRTQFKPRLYAHDNGDFPTKSKSGATGTLTQLWFPGAHCDVGGGYDLSRSVLSDTALAWLVSEAVAKGLRLSKGGVKTTSEEAVAAALATRYPPSNDARARAHSELRRTPLWALTGMSVRDTTRVDIDGKAPMAVTPVPHGSVARRHLDFATGSSWMGAVAGKGVWFALLLVVVWPLVLGQLLLGFNTTGTLWGDIAAALHQIRPYLCSNVAFQIWQLTGWWAADWQGPMHQFHAPRWALVWDFVLIAAYAYVLSWFAAKAFARLAGLRQVGDPPRPWLNRFGWALPLMVFADVGENLFTWAAITLGGNDMELLARLAHFCAALLSLAKLVGLVGTLGLIGAGIFGGRRSNRA